MIKVRVEAGIGCSVALEVLDRQASSTDASVSRPARKDVCGAVCVHGAFQILAIARNWWVKPLPLKICNSVQSNFVLRARPTLCQANGTQLFAVQYII